MIGLIQVVTFAEVKVNQQCIGRVERGTLALIGMEKEDNIIIGNKLIDKILQYRIFPDADGKTNLSLKDINGGLLLVPQFTLVAETQKGLRPGYSKGIAWDEGNALFSEIVQSAQTKYQHVQSGEYGAYMQVTLCNDGPMTFYLKVS